MLLNHYSVLGIPIGCRRTFQPFAVGPEIAGLSGKIFARFLSLWIAIGEVNTEETTAGRLEAKEYGL
jgi:hypothetical protein